MLLDSALLKAVRPGTRGSSGTVARWRSKAALKVSLVHAVVFRSSSGRVLNSEGPLMAMEDSLAVRMVAGSRWLTGGTLQVRPLRACQLLVIGSCKLGT